MREREREREMLNLDSCVQGSSCWISTSVAPALGFGSLYTQTRSPIAPSIPSPIHHSSQHSPCGPGPVSDCEAIPRQRDTRLIQQTACAAHTAIPPSSPTEEAGRQMEVLHRPDSTPKLSKETLTQLTLGC